MSDLTIGRWKRERWNARELNLNLSIMKEEMTI